MILVVLCVVLFFIAKAQVKRADQAERKAASYHEAYTEMERRARSLRKLLQKYKQVEEENHEARQNLAGTADTDLVHRANALFGVQDNPSEERAGNG
jgi:Skp family chaperone for outer membrane proteins